MMRLTILFSFVVLLLGCQGEHKRNNIEHDFQKENTLIGEWEMSQGKNMYYIMYFSKYHIVRCKKFVDGELKKDKSYSYSCYEDYLRLGYMFTGEEYKSVKVVEHSTTKLVLHGWPKRGDCVFIKQ
jgi:hypothetical protein